MHAVYLTMNLSPSTFMVQNGGAFEPISSLFTVSTG